MNNHRTVSPEYAAQILLRGISMGQFIIIGTWVAGVMHSIKNSSMNLISQLILAPFAILLKRFHDYKVRNSIFQV